MRQAFALIFVICTAGTAIAQGAPPIFNVEVKVPLEARTLKGAPYSAEVVNDYTQVLTDGNRIVQHSTGRVYRDREGRVRREEDRASATPSISIVDPIAGVSYSLDPESHIAWKTPGLAGLAIVRKFDAAAMTTVVGGPRPRRAPIVAAGVEGVRVEGGDRNAGNVIFEVNGQVAGYRRFNPGDRPLDGGSAGGVVEDVEEALAPRTMEGVVVAGRRLKTTIAAGAIGNEWPLTVTSEEWTSPELQILVLTDRKDPRLGDSTYRLVHISRDEPAATLFQVPADYTIKETGISRFDMPNPEQ
ncbi:MAG TPA: hypothetical protein VHT95_03170 [Vicinamibacterales bacterium]|jgi:hypothetical protein|nr:hypothetical protein [Vicinamibacterales bacterium]